ncbi:ATP-dependent Clp protease adapter ClpS [bacterium]|nr:ATP-dependent Clp protease adapter ClpS [bacterium]
MGNPSWKLNEDAQEKVKQRTKTPSLYKVFLLNDDYTTMEFVVDVLQEIFHKPFMEANEIMLHVHKNGKGLAGIYTREIAETKVTAVHFRARESGFPLKCSMEKE